MEQSMDPRSRKLLEAFDSSRKYIRDTENVPEGSAAHGGALELAALGELAAWRPVAEKLVERGWLRRAGGPDAYARTEEGRLAVAGPLDVTLYTRPGCHLCEEAKAQIAPLLQRAGARLREVNIDADPELRERYNMDVPVIFLSARKVAKHRVNLEQFRRELNEVRRKPERFED